MPYITDRKQFLREIDLAMLIADDDDDDDDSFLELDALASFSRFTQDRTKRHRDDHFFIEKFPILTDADIQDNKAGV